MRKLLLLLSLSACSPKTPQYPNCLHIHGQSEDGRPAMITYCGSDVVCRQSTSDQGVLTECHLSQEGEADSIDPNVPKKGT